MFPAMELPLEGELKEKRESLENALQTLSEKLPLAHEKFQTIIDEVTENPETVTPETIKS